ncbi:MAG: polysaccharide pyruvyl transferase family protein [Flavobacterium sp.]|uniref:polysaccharide pyruvyl transferase family protein n=1 Tax=Flavobacterium sp. TaxID=239 RepID=UPI0025B81EED|nr:polysaccharide pyruvyl transferase family protein [Flavobacterium sp.]MCK6607364.1 polysaccharide pyruvyl transferase family protein [Flavobacterium sp.]
MNKIHVYWWALKAQGEIDNYGDILAPFLAEKLSGKKVVKVSHPMQRWYKWFIKHYVTVGSIICAASKNSIVWGSGIIKKNENVRAAKFVAVRGPRTRKRLLELGYQVPEVYGDPALLLPKFISNVAEKKYALGIIPHYVDYDAIVARFKDDATIKVINLMTNDVVKTTQEILECKQIISSSLHGVIVSHAYEIPALWVKFSNKLAGDNVKFYDYFESLNITYSKEFYINPSESSIADFEKLLSENTSILLPSKDKLIQTQEALFASCPFKK